MNDQAKVKKFTMIIIGYPVVLILASVLINVLVFGVSDPVVTLPEQGVVSVLAVSGALLLINHSWLMTATELIRLRYGIYASPEEYANAGRHKDDVPEHGWAALERCHNAHRNATENTVYFALVVILCSVMSAPAALMMVWSFGFAVARLGYSWSALGGRSGWRGLFMSVSLLALYGLATYPLLVFGLPGLG